MTELRTAPELEAVSDFTGDELVPIGGAVAGSGLFRAKLSKLKAYFTAGLSGGGGGGGGDATPIDASGLNVRHPALILVEDGSLGVAISGPGGVTAVYHATRHFTGDVTAIGRITNGSREDFSGVGVMLRESATGKTLISVITWVDESRAGTGQWLEGKRYNADGSEWAGAQHSNTAFPTCWMRVKKVGAQSTASYSFDRRTWFDLLTDSSIAFDEVGIVINQATSTKNGGLVSSYDDGVVSWHRPDGGI